MWIPDIQYGIQAVRQVWSIYFLESSFHKPGLKTLKWDPTSQRRVNMGFGKVIQHNFGWLWTWWMVQYHFSFIIYWWYILLCCENHSSRYRIMDMTGPVKEFKDQGNVRPMKMIRVGWRMVDFRWSVDTFLSKLERGLLGGSKDQSRHLFKDPNILRKT